ncbi:putative type IX secretion system sortase PorU2 [Sediminitomix flava]|uniref:Peptidase C25-like protein n=1 Tax=Sediminitomix flava TaxID=379075 RepID=A0A315Z6W7_SEDFL|nr:C25 family cysteine peptidase [Sediminitomix flava]PWJ38411.1 peptidase C25-like protein [Sediminitomix flava]
MKYIKAFIFLIISLLSTPVVAQNNFDWIGSSFYYKMEVRETGRYRVSYDDVSNLVLGLSSLKLSELQVYHRGQELAIFVYDQNGNDRFESEDYFEFYGVKNDGALDDELYQGKDNRMNPYESLYSHSSFYFFTFNNAGILGKRIEDAPKATAGTPVQNTVKRAENISYRNVYFKGERIIANSNVYASSFKRGAGFVNNGIRETHRDYTIQLENYIPNSEVKLETNIVTVDTDASGEYNIYVGKDASSLTLLDSKREYDVTLTQHEYELNSDLINTDGSFIFRLEATLNAVALSYFQIEYNSANSISGNNSLHFSTQSDDQNNIVEISDLNSDFTAWDISDIYNIKSIQQENANLLTWQSSTTNPKVYLSSEYKNLFSIKATNWNINTDPTRFDYLMIYHESLKGSAAGYSDVIDAYKSYRESAQGGGYNVESKSIEEIYDLFSYGEITPLAIRNYVNFMYEEDHDKYLFLIGQGLEVASDYYNKQYSLKNTKYQSLVPTYGTNSSDNLLGSKTNEDGTPLIGVGRISCWTAQQLADYFNKVKEHEFLAMSQIWKKNVLHVRGGSSTQDAFLMDRIMNQLKTKATSAYLGGNVDDKTRETFEDFISYVNISEQVNEGRSMISYLGHSSASFLDMDIGYVSQDKYGFNNRSKYPLVFVNGCNAGNVFTKDRLNSTAYHSWAEDWTFTPQKGSIIFLGMASTGTLNNLEDYMNLLYDYQFNNKGFINKPIGKILVEMTKQKYSSSTLAFKAHLQQYILNGDPAVKLFNTNEVLADFAVTDQLEIESLSSVSEVSASDDAFILKVPIQNLGFTYDNQELDIQLVRKFPDNSITEYFGELGSNNFYLDTNTDSLNHSSTLNIYVSNTNEDKTKGSGVNNFTLNLNYLGNIDEQSVLNNTISSNIFIPDGQPIFISPFNHQVTDQDNLNILIQNVGYLGASNVEYTFTLDDSYNFDTPLLTEQITGGTYASLSISRDDFNFQEQVYYLKVEYKDGDNILENTINFQWVNNSTNGWGQFSQYQFKNTATSALRMRSNINISPQLSPEWYFPNEKEIYVKSSGVNSSSPSYELSIDGLTYLENGGPDRACRDHRFLTIFIDKDNGELYQTNTHWSVRGVFCGLKANRSDFGANIYASVPFAPTEFNKIFDGPKSGFPAYSKQLGDHIIFLAQGNINFSSLGQDDINTLDQIGIDSDSFSQLQKGEPYIAFAKNNKEFEFNSTFQALEIKADTNSNISPLEQTIEHTYTINLNIDKGELESEIIGPAINTNGWKQAIVNIDAENSDSNELYIFGFKNDGSSELIQQTILNNNINNLDLSYIPSDTYPYLQLKWVSTDSINRTPSDLRSWHVEFDEAADGSLNYVSKSEESYKEGQIASNEFSFYNTGNVSFSSDSLLVQFSIDNQLDSEIKIAAPAVGDSTTFAWERSTEGLKELNELTVTVNPDNNESTVLEKTYINNSLPYFFEVELDTYSPYTDVFFDGKRIMNGEVVSPNAIVNVLIKDDNEHLPMTEVPENMKVFLGRANTGELGNITSGFLKEDFTFDDNSIGYSDYNSNEKDELSVLYDLTDQNLETGIYALMIQNIEDRAGNGITNPDNTLRPEEKEHIVIFEVNTEKTVTQVYPYPNPFSDKVRFVFTITGSEAPTQMKIQIMTVTGKIVREITQDELGPIRIGDNISDYAWDGKDEFGDQLANGVYLYRVIWGDGFSGFKTKSDDKLFKNNIGKMYLLR